MARLIRRPDNNGDSAAAKQAAAEHHRRLAEEYDGQRELTKGATAQQKVLRDLIMKEIEEHGNVDENGNVWLPAMDWMLKDERRVSSTFDPEKAEEWLRKRGLWDAAKVTVPEQVIPAHDIIGEESFNRFLWEHRTDDTLPNEAPDELYNIKETHALQVTREEQYDY